MTLKRVIQCCALVLMLVPAAAFADTFNLTGGTWIESGDSLILHDGTTTIDTGNLGFLVPIVGFGDQGSVNTTPFSCTDCVASTEFINGGSIFDPDIFVSGVVEDGGVTGSFTAEITDPLYMGHGSIDAGSLSLTLPTAPAPEPGTWLLLLVGIGLLGTAGFARKQGWLSDIAAESKQG